MPHAARHALVGLVLFCGVSVQTSARQATAQTPVTATESSDQKAYIAASSLQKPEERAAALKKFLADFPNSTLREPAAFRLAQSAPSAPETIAALKQFLVDFPNSSQRDQANYLMAVAPTAAAERRASLAKFLADFPTSRLREQAEYQLTMTMTDAAERQKAQEAFVKDHPKSLYATPIYQMWFDASVREKPVNEARLNAAIDGLMAATPDRSLTLGEFTMNQRASALNTIADRLMANDVMLDRALSIIEEAVKLAGDKERPETQSMITTTMGEVLFKSKRYEDAGVALKKAAAIPGADADGENQLFLGKYYEWKGDEPAALAAYMKASELGSPMDTRASLEHLFLKKYGSLASLESKLDEMYRAKPRAFDAGHFSRPPVKGPARVVLAELFTGAECGPCVSADLSLDGFRERYDHHAVAVIVYHLHIPGPDPMTNPDALARAKYYGVNATPNVFMDGMMRREGGGEPKEVFADYTKKAETRIATAPQAVLSRFKLEVDGDTLKVTGQASMLPSATERTGRASLHLAVVDDSVRYVGSNGVRFHSYVVRKLLGSPEGVAMPKTGEKLSVAESVSAKAISTALDAYLDEFAKTPYRGTPVAFKDRVDQLDPKRLRVVAFVQDDQTKEILQSVFIGGK